MVKVRILSLVLLCALCVPSLGGMQVDSGCEALAPGTQLPADTGCPGPYAVARAEYDNRDAYPNGVALDGVDTPIDIWARVSYPEGFPNGPAPLVLILHGNQAACGGILASCYHHEGFQYLIDHLASHGFVAVSINANRINAGDFDRVRDRAVLMLAHLERWSQWATVTADGPLGDTFLGNVDLGRIGLAGHSRGGEAAVVAIQLNRQRPDPFTIGAVLALAPTDKQGLSIENVPYYALVPACDGDVLDYRGVRFFDRALQTQEEVPTPKQVAFVIGANHNHFNTLWSTDGGGCSGIELLPRAAQEGVAKRLSAAFFRRYLLDEAALHYVFTGDRAGPATPQVPVWISYADPVRLDVDDFGQSSQQNRLGGSASFFDFRKAATCGPASDRPCSIAFVHETPALALAWLHKAALYETQIPPGYRDVRGFTHLSLRVTQNPEDARLDSFDLVGKPVHFEVRLADAAGRTASLSTERFGGAPFPIGSTVLDPASGKRLRRAVLRTLRLPLDQFVGVDLSQVVWVALAFDPQSQGSLYLSHLQFTR